MPDQELIYLLELILRIPKGLGADGINMHLPFKVFNSTFFLKFFFSFIKTYNLELAESIFLES